MKQNNEMDLLIHSIKRYQKDIRKQDCKIVKAIAPETIARISVICIYESINQFHSTQQAAMSIGRELLRPYENDNEDESRANIRRFKVGVDIIYLLERVGLCREQFLIKETGDGKQKGMYYILNNFIWILQDIYDKVRIPDMSKPDMSFRPQFTKPKEWKRFNHPVFGSLVRKCNPIIKEKLTKRSAKKIYNCVNKLQSASLSVDTELLNVFLHSLTKKVFTLSDKNYTEEQRNSIYKDASDVLQLAHDIGDREFWTGYFLDYRYRVYPTMTRLNLVSSKLSKSLIRSGVKRRINEEGVSWLKLHIANCCGKDKLPIDERVQWTEDNWDTLETIALDPINQDGWMELDDPFNALGAILELHRHNSDPDYKSGCLIAFDATNSGAQILSALVRDKKGMKLTNLNASDKIEDLYLTCADRAWDMMGKDSYWNQHFDRRRMCSKRVIMTIFYSCGVKTAAQHLLEDFAHEPWAVGLDEDKALELAKALHKSAKIELPEVMDVMKIFVEYANTFSGNYEDASWTVPSTGAFVSQYYRYNNTRRITVRKNGDVKKYIIITEKNKYIEVKGATTGVAPNITHSLDASLVHWLISNSEYDIFTIHDSFMAHPNDAGNLFEDVRTSIKDITGPDVLKKLLNGRVENIGLGEGVMSPEDNEYCFS